MTILHEMYSCVAVVRISRLDKGGSSRSKLDAPVVDLLAPIRDDVKTEMSGEMKTEAKPVAVY